VAERGVLSVDIVDRVGLESVVAMVEEVPCVVCMEDFGYLTATARFERE
jgi:hypothetical protein